MTAAASTAERAPQVCFAYKVQTPVSHTPENPLAGRIGPRGASGDAHEAD